MNKFCGYRRPRAVEEMFENLKGYRDQAVEWSGVVELPLKNDAGLYEGKLCSALSGYFVRIPVKDGEVCLLVEGDIAPFKAVVGKKARVTADINIGWLDLGFGNTLSFIRARHHPMPEEERPAYRLVVHNDDNLSTNPNITSHYAAAVRGKGAKGYVVVRDNN